MNIVIIAVLIFVVINSRRKRKKERALWSVYMEELRKDKSYYICDWEVW